MEDGHNNPIIDGPEPSRWATLFAALKAAFKALMAKRPAVPTAPQPKARQSKAQRRDQAMDETRAELAKADRAVHGPPAIWMAPFFLVFAAAYGVPMFATAFAEAAPRAFVSGFVGHLPAAAGRIEPLMMGWLWAPWWLAAAALFMRLNAAWTSGRAVLDAVGWGMGALALEGAAWLFVGRKAVLNGYSPAEQEGAWQLLVLEFLFLLLTAIAFSPTTRYRALPR